MARRRPSSSRWLQEHHNDPYVKAARASGYRSRAVFKLLEIQERYTLIRAGHTVVDLGAAPGGWTQVAVKLAGGNGRVVGVDLLPIDPVPGAVLLQGDFLDEAVAARLRALLPPEGADLVLSDMAPNMSGFKSADQARGELLAETAFHFAGQVLRPGGAMVLKLFQGPGFHQLVAEARQAFAATRVVKPQASRSRSPEHYLVATGFRALPAIHDEDAP